MSCGEAGLFVGDVALLEPVGIAETSVEWRPRPLDDINRELSRLYGSEVDAVSKLHGLASISRALERGDIAHAQLAALFLRLPDPRPLSRSAARPDSTAIELAKDLRASGLLKMNWDPAKHPRWPGGTAGGIGGEFAPAGDASSTEGEAG